MPLRNEQNSKPAVGAIDQTMKPSPTSLRIFFHRFLWHAWKAVRDYADTRARTHRSKFAKTTCADFAANRGNLEK